VAPRSVHGGDRLMPSEGSARARVAGRCSGPCRQVAWLAGCTGGARRVEGAEELRRVQHALATSSTTSSLTFESFEYEIYLCQKID